MSEMSETVNFISRLNALAAAGKPTPSPHSSKPSSHRPDHGRVRRLLQDGSD
jgi:hypothetical protein